MFLLSAIFVILANNYFGLKSVGFVAFLPQLLAYVFGLSQVGITLPASINRRGWISDKGNGRNMYRNIESAHTE